MTRLVREKFPEYESFTAEQQDRMDSEKARRDAAVLSSDVTDLLHEYGISQKFLDRLIEVNQEQAFADQSDGTESESRSRVFVLSVDSHFSADMRLPDGYGYKGGAARVLLERALGIDVSGQPRDLDVIRLSWRKPEKDLDVQVGYEFMPDDMETGNGVEVIGDEWEYFDSRDLTLNQVWANDTEIRLTEACLLDTVRHILRPTEYERRQKVSKHDGAEVGNKMMAKMIRLYVDLVEQYGYAELIGLDVWMVESSFISPFWLAVNLDRAFENGTADQFFSEIKRLRQVPDKVKSAEEAGVYLLRLMSQSDFYFRNAPIEQYEYENLLDETTGVTIFPFSKEDGELDEYDILPFSLGHGRGRG